jgi:hypothetical protein
MPAFTGMMMAAPLLAGLLLAGCIPGVTGPVPTFTPDATLQAIPRLLTEAAAAPTGAAQTAAAATRSAPTITPTARPTQPVPVTGSEEKPSPTGAWMALEGARLAVLSPQVATTSGQTVLWLEVVLENTSAQPIPYSAMYFRLVYEGEAREPLGGAEIPPIQAAPALLSGDLLPGERARGSLVFPVVDEESDWLLRYQAEPDPAVWVHLALAAPGAFTTPAPIPTPTGLPGEGRRVEAAGVALTISDVRSEERFERRRAPRDMEYLILHAQLENVSRMRLPVNTAYFKLQDALGYEYRPAALPSEALLTTGSLGEGQRAEGLVVFAIPPEADGLILKFNPQTLLEEFEEIRVGITRE